MKGKCGFQSSPPHPFFTLGGCGSTEQASEWASNQFHSALLVHSAVEVAWAISEWGGHPTFTRKVTISTHTPPPFPLLHWAAPAQASSGPWAPIHSTGFPPSWWPCSYILYQRSWVLLLVAMSYLCSLKKHLTIISHQSILEPSLDHSQAIKLFERLSFRLPTHSNMSITVLALQSSVSLSPSSPYLQLSRLFSDL